PLAEWRTARSPGPMLGNTRRLAIKSSSISEAPAQSTPAMGKKAATTAKVTMILRMVFQITPGFQWLLDLIGAEPKTRDGLGAEAAGVVAGTGIVGFDENRIHLDIAGGDLKALG